MANKKLARTLAVKINPIISPVGLKDTIAQCAQLIDQLGTAVANAECIEDAQNMNLLTAVVAAALRFELELQRA